jgi:hypothetical protein
MKVNEIITEAANPAQQAAIAISMKKAGKKPNHRSMNLRPVQEAQTAVITSALWPVLGTMVHTIQVVCKKVSKPIKT